VPIYGPGGSKSDPRDKLPPRPAGQRSEPETSPRNFGFGDAQPGFHMSFIAGFPFGIFAHAFNVGGGGVHAQAGQQVPDFGSPEFMQDQLVGKVFLWIACIFLLWLLVA